MDFPIIKNIDDIKCELDDNFTVKVADEYTIISYIVPSLETFPDGNSKSAKIRREFRGITFCNKTGNIIRRPFQKFFNIQEREDTLTRNLIKMQHATILDKLDGSMCAPFVTHSGKLIWGTQMCDTHLTEIIANFVKTSPQHEKISRFFINQNKTPIFEYLDSVNNRIVLDYGKDTRMVLTAVRDNISGTYEPHGYLQNIAHLFNVDIVGQITDEAFSEEFINKAVKQENIEGYVIRFLNGHMVKVKNEWYVNLHRAKSSLINEKDVVKMILDGVVDDIKCFLEDDDKQQLEEFEISLHKRISSIVDQTVINIDIMRKSGISKKQLALEYQEKTPYWIMMNLFKAHDNENYSKEDVRNTLYSFILKNCSKTKSYNENLINNGVLTGCIRWKSLMFFGDSE